MKGIVGLAASRVATLAGIPIPKAVVFGADDVSPRWRQRSGGSQLTRIVRLASATRPYAPLCRGCVM
jgi:hypothetical protein